MMQSSSTAQNIYLPKITGETSFLFMRSFDMFLEVMVECGLVAADMAHLEVTFFRMAISHMLLEAFL